jgi:hypothetical protein
MYFQWYELIIVFLSSFVYAEGAPSQRYLTLKLVKNMTIYLKLLETYLNDFIYSIRYISLKDENSISCPAHIPMKLMEVFNEGTACYSIGCYNASVAMFRLCLDLDTKPLAEQHNVTGMLGQRLVKLFKQQLLPIALEELSHCIKDNGNDGAHDGTITEDEALDVMDFTISYLETRHTMPERIRLRKEAREARKAE